MGEEPTHTTEIPPGGEKTVRKLSAVAAGGILLFWLIVIVLGLVTPDYSAVSDAISDLGAVNAPYGIVQQANFIILGISVLAFTIGIHKHFRSGWRPWLGVFLIGLFALVAPGGSAVFPVDKANPEAMTNILHGISVSVGFMIALVGIPFMAWRLSADERWPAYHTWKAVAGIAVLGFVGFALLLSGMATPWAGLAQRLFIGSVTGVLLYHSFKLYQLSGRSESIVAARM